jgi:aspartyl-tRNA(Asn)/glutamyl-tRNA(Gln) amidotransferase subunit C
MTKVDVRALAKLARLDVSDEELAKLETEIPAILGFVETIQQASVEVVVTSPEHRNIMRDDVDPIESGLHTRELIDAAPTQKDDQVVVKQVLSKRK